MRFYRFIFRLTRARQKAGSFPVPERPGPPERKWIPNIAARYRSVPARRISEAGCDSIEYIPVVISVESMTETAQRGLEQPEKNRRCTGGRRDARVVQFVALPANRRVFSCDRRGIGASPG